jgi:hypothetical protein
LKKVSTPYGKAGDAILTSLPQRRSEVLWQMGRGPKLITAWPL